MKKEPSFPREYGRQVFWHWDAKLGYIVGLVTVAALSSSTVARSRLNDLSASGVTVAALGLTFALTSMSLLSAIVDTRMVQVLDGLERGHASRTFGLHGLLVAFRSVAVIGGSGVAFWFVVRAVSVDTLRGNGWDAAQVASGSFAMMSTTWLLGALVGLVNTVAVLIGGKAELIRHHDLQERPAERPSSERSA